MTEAPKTIWAARGLYWLNSSRTYPAPVKYIRSDIAQSESDTLRAEAARLRCALQRMVYETTHLSPQQDDGSHWCNISHDALTEARAALSDVSS